MLDETTFEQSKGAAKKCNMKVQLFFSVCLTSDMRSKEFLETVGTDTLSEEIVMLV